MVVHAYGGLGYRRAYQAGRGAPEPEPGQLDVIVDMGSTPLEGFTRDL